MTSSMNLTTSQTTETEIRKPVSPGDFWDNFFPGQDRYGLAKRGYGNCDPLQWNVRQGAELWRYSKVYFQLRLAAGVLSIQGGTQRIMASAGTGETNATDTGFPGKLTLSQTDLNKTGAPGKEGEVFRLRSLGFRVGRPVSMETEGDPASFVSFGNEDWIENYHDRIRDLAMEMISVKGTFVDEDCKFDGGPIGHWPQHAGQATTPMTNGLPIGLWTLTPLARVVDMGQKDERDQMNLELTWDLTTTFTQNDMIEFESDLWVPVEGIFYGYNHCLPCDPKCLPEPSGRIDYDRLAEAMVRAQIALK